MKSIKIILLEALLVIIVLIQQARAEISMPIELDISHAIQEGDNRVARGELLRAWNLYRTWLNEKEGINHAVFETEPGHYQNAQTVISKKMAQILDHPNLPQLRHLKWRSYGNDL